MLHQCRFVCIETEDDKRLVVWLPLGSTWPLATRTPGTACPQCIYDQLTCVDVVILGGIMKRVKLKLVPFSFHWVYASGGGSPPFLKWLGLHRSPPRPPLAAPGCLLLRRWRKEVCHMDSEVTEQYQLHHHPDYRLLPPNHAHKGGLLLW